MAVVVTIAKGYDLGYIWKTQDHTAQRTVGGYYLNAAQAGEPPGRWWGPGAQALGLTPGQTVDRKPYDAIYRQTDPRTGARLGRARGRPRHTLLRQEDARTGRHPPAAQAVHRAFGKNPSSCRRTRYRTRGRRLTARSADTANKTRSEAKPQGERVKRQ